MRLIDADELLKHKGNCYDEDGHLLYAVGTGDIINAPTIDAESVRHGRWVKSPEYRYSWICSECNVLQGFDHMLMYYCPRCGARMDGGEDDEDAQP